MVRKKQVDFKSVVIRGSISVLLLAAAAYVLATHWQIVTDSVRVARHAELSWLLFATVLMVLTFCIAAAIYGVLAIRPLFYRQTLLVEISTAFVNRLLPSGLGGLGLHGIYLYKRKYTTAEATVVVSINNLIGMAGHILLLTVLIAFDPHLLRQLFAAHGLEVPWQVFLITAIVVVGLCFIPLVRRSLGQFLQNVWSSLRRLRTTALVNALCLAVLLTMTYTTILFAVAHSIGIELSALPVFIIFSIGMLTSTATPTPGGLVGAEAGLYAGFIAYGVKPTDAAAAVLLYRVITYWIPLVPGIIGLGFAKRLRLV